MFEQDEEGGVPELSEEYQIGLLRKKRGRSASVRELETRRDEKKDEAYFNGESSMNTAGQAPPGNRICMENARLDR